MNDRIPDDFDTRYAIDGVQRAIDRGRDPYQGIESAQSMIAYVVSTGGTLAAARSYAIEAALHRDRKLTPAELDVKRGARLQHYPTSSTSAPTDVAAAAEPQTTAAQSGAPEALPSAATPKAGAPDLLTAGAA
ncbi:hypothetical protein JNB62_15890 [Microbacterium jejuense]|uniref:Uncharacterized protein n=1 Tax=Microbacterium jejuense TaxID=1263637 RepID=A0ABS7HTC8_9MICO|nr:hypothetical protein [Microbacterium jejuense]MBW9095168.1 hypothetical protein [Microbacterium jejuense]